MKKTCYKQCWYIALIFMDPTTIQISHTHNASWRLYHTLIFCTLFTVLPPPYLFQSSLLPQHTNANWLAAYQNWIHFRPIVSILMDNYLNVMGIPLTIIKRAHYQRMVLLEYSPILNSSYSLNSLSHFLKALGLKHGDFLFSDMVISLTK